MPELTPMLCYTCPTNIEWECDIQGKTGTYLVSYTFHFGWHCTCKGYQFRKTCKHIQQAKQKRCGWNWQAVIGNKGKTKDNKCPRCQMPLQNIVVGI